ncbi:MAG: xanthine dehydrogenase family protein molybdopterin-binding subunit [Acidobacteria bacterium]|nr:xanthine dehydrogenase family protein molybdopterin-binding subunit [Acidobacteriota bacterium]
MNKWTRRTFIGAGTVAGGGFLLGVAGFTFAPGRHTLVGEDASEKGQLTTWITVTPDNVITVLIPHCEMGQGTLTALAMMAAEEMEADWSMVRVLEAPALGEYANGYVVRAAGGDYIPAVMARGVDYGSFKAAQWFGFQVTGGSTAVRSTGEYGMRVAGAAAKEMLLSAAARQWGVPAADCAARASRIVHAASGRSAAFGELARTAATLPVPTSPALKEPDTFTIRRTSPPRLDIPPKVDGSAVYGIDFTTPGMLYAALEIAPVQGGRLTSVDAAPAEAMPGVRQVVGLEEAVAVVADSFWRARRALAALKPVFDDAGHGAVSTTSIFAAFDAALGPPPEMPAGAARVVTADYRVPFLAHATMEPMACTARVEGDGAEVWTGVQDPLNARSVAAKALGIKPEQVRVTNLLLGGGFGRRLPFNFDYVDLAVRIAKAVSPVPVKTIWTRENDIQHDYYRPAAMSRHAGALDAGGAPLAVKSHYTGGGNGEAVFMPYAITDTGAEEKEANHPIRPGQWRSVLNSQHGFFKESFIDEMAHAAGKDPYEFRRALLGNRPRFKAVLERVAAMANWGAPLPAGEGRGIALCESFGTIVGEVAHVAVSAEGGLRVRHVYAAVDCGDVVNPDSATAQVEGAIVFALSAAMLSEITIAGGRVVETNFRDYPMIHLAEAPRITAEFIRSDATLGGLGEPIVPPLAPAVTNAIFAATGVRVRNLPIRNQAAAVGLTPSPDTRSAPPPTGGSPAR